MTGRTIDISGKSLFYLLAGVSIAGLLAIVVVASYPFEEPATLGLAVLFVGLAIVMVVHLWRVKTGRADIEFAPPGNVTHRPLSPGWMAKERWQKTVDSLPGTDENDEDG